MDGYCRDFPLPFLTYLYFLYYADCIPIEKLAPPSYAT